MHQAIRIVFVLMAAFAALHGAHAARASIKDEIARELSQPRPAYRLDAAKKMLIQGAIRKWVEGHMDLGKAVQTQKDDRRVWKLTRSRNLPIPSTTRSAGRGADSARASAAAQGPFDSFYIEEPGDRTFSKDIWQPVSARLGEAQLKSVGRHFAEEQGFLRTTAKDRVLDVHVVSWRYLELDGIAKGSRRQSGGRPAGEGVLTLRHRIRLAREFAGREVINSVQYVDVHPESLEILGYSSMDWSPINESSGQLKKYRSSQDLFDEIRQAFGDQAVNDQALNVHQAWFESQDWLLPVLMVVGKAPEGRNGKEQWLILRLIEELALEPDEKEGVDCPGTPPPRKR